jgi:hypothetical protein
METRELRLKRSDSINRKSRKIILGDELWEIIHLRWNVRKYKDEKGEWHISPLVFCRVRGKGVRKTGASVGDFRKIWKKACEEASRHQYTLHAVTLYHASLRSDGSGSLSVVITLHPTQPFPRRYVTGSTAHFITWL